MVKQSSLSDAIKKLSKKDNVISQEAKAAKEHFEKEKESQALDPYSKKISEKQIALITEFEESLKILSAIFKKSRFDELVVFITNPKKMLLVNFLIGLIRGIGWMFGVLIILFVFGILIKDCLLPILGPFLEQVFLP
ncbi:DUF5665 domain-containing protein [Candidatus Margulisiibacteriota bacterium]